LESSTKITELATFQYNSGLDSVHSILLAGWLQLVGCCWLVAAGWLLVAASCCWSAAACHWGNQMTEEEMDS